MRTTAILILISISMTSTRCYQHAPAYPQYDQTETEHDRLDQTQWSKRDSRSTGISERDSQTQISENYVQALSDQDDQAIQRMSKRSLPLYSGRQRLQDVQRRRFNQEDKGPRVVNVNNDFGFHLMPRRGVLPEPVTSPEVAVVPGPSRRAAQFVPNVPEECRRMGICEHVPDYPEEHVAAIIKQLGNDTDKFNLDELDTPEVASRIGRDDTELCDFSLKIAAPMAARDKHDNWLYILNRKNNPFQGFHIEICKEAGNLCSNKAYFYTGYEAKCQQKFMLRFMKALDANGKLVEKQFKMPSCCSCVVRQKNE